MQIELNCILLAPYPTCLSVLFGPEAQPVSVYYLCPDTYYPSRLYIQLRAAFLPDKSQNRVSFQDETLKRI